MDARCQMKIYLLIRVTFRNTQYIITIYNIHFVWILYMYVTPHTHIHLCTLSRLGIKQQLAW